MPKPSCKTLLTLLLLSFLIPQTVQAGEFRERLKERLMEKRKTGGERDTPSTAPTYTDISYGSHSLQSFDVYLPESAAKAPVLFFVHGGGWKRGDKGAGSVGHKADYWLAKGYILVSVNYRLSPDYHPLIQAEDVAKALAEAQKRATSWGGNPDDFVLMGHSAGAHLVAFLGANPDFAFKQGAIPWRGTIPLDSAALNVPAVMERRHARLYDDAFGKNPVFWKSISPLHHLSAQATPMLLVCSSSRKDNPCGEADLFAEAAAKVGVKMKVLPEDLSHGEILSTLGKENTYTKTVNNFMQEVRTAKSGK